MKRLFFLTVASTSLAFTAASLEAAPVTFEARGVISGVEVFGSPSRNVLSAGDGVRVQFTYDLDSRNIQTFNNGDVQTVNNAITSVVYLDDNDNVLHTIDNLPNTITQSNNFVSPNNGRTYDAFGLNLNASPNPRLRSGTGEFAQINFFLNADTFGTNSEFGLPVDVNLDGGFTSARTSFLGDNGETIRYNFDFFTISGLNSVSNGDGTLAVPTPTAFAGALMLLIPMAFKRGKHV
ncbi:hypothetical protein JD969_01560 [Planctomycetota bacterium]|nr:hypothetical protein JD969_01560 [Planctomycetota bacterium]